jgi:hypothetical protein
MEIIIMVIMLAFVWIMGIIAGWNAHDRFVQKAVRGAIHELQETPEHSRVRITIEEHNGMLFAYEYGTNQFMAQGNTKQELEEQLRLKFPDTMFAALPTEVELLRKMGL